MFLLWTLIFTIKAAEAIVLTSPQVLAQDNATTYPSLEAVSVDPLWQTNTSTNSLNVSTDIYYYCNTKFGIGINVESCYRAITRVPEYRSTVQRTFGMRGTGVRYDFTLPKWFISVDGKCVLQVQIIRVPASASASFMQLFHGASNVINHCIEGNNPPPGTVPGTGGFATNLGPNGDLGIAVRKGDPSNIRCYGNAAVKAIVNSCQLILDSMAVDSQQRTFGAEAGSSVHLPWTQEATDKRCYMTLRSSGLTDISRWEDIWKAAAMITGMCPSQGKKGVKTGLGTKALLYLEVGALPQPEAEVASSSTL